MWVTSASNTSKRSSPKLGAEPLPDTNLNLAPRSMKRRISHAQATTCLPWRVIHVRSFWCARATVGRLAPLANASTAVASPLPSLPQQQPDNVLQDESPQFHQA